MGLIDITYTDNQSKHERRVVYTATFDDHEPIEHTRMCDKTFDAEGFLPRAEAIILESLNPPVEKQVSDHSFIERAIKAIRQPLPPKEIIREVKVVEYVDRPVDKIVYVDKEVIKEVPVDREVIVKETIYVDQPRDVERVVYVDKPMPYPVEVERIREVPIPPTMKSLWAEWMRLLKGWWNG